MYRRASSLEAWKIVLYTLHGLAMSSCLARLLYRKRTHRLWWDDFWALFAMLSDATLLVTHGIRKSPNNTPQAMNILRWISLTAFTFVIWASRLSVAVTIVRLVPPGPGRCVAKAASMIFAMIMCTLVLQKLFICQKLSGGLDISACQLPKETGILELCVDLVADIWLICSPVYLLWHIKLNRRRQVVIFSVFASDIVLTTASIVHCIFIFRQKGDSVFISGHFQITISLLICNLLVLVTWVYSRFYPIDNDEDSSSSEYPPTRRTQRPNNIPNYGFEGSVLMLTQLSGQSSLLDSLLDSALDRKWKRPRSHTLDAFYPKEITPPEILPPRLRPSRSSPALLYLAVPVAPIRLPNGYNISWLNHPPPPNRKPRLPSLVDSSATDDLYSLPDGTVVIRERRLIQQDHQQRPQDLMARIDER